MIWIARSAYDVDQAQLNHVFYGGYIDDEKAHVKRMSRKPTGNGFNSNVPACARLKGVMHIMYDLTYIICILILQQY